MEEGLKSSTSCNSLMQPDDNDLQHASGQLKFAPTDSINNQLLSFIDLDEIFADHFFPDDIDFTNFFAIDSVIEGNDAKDVAEDVDLDLLINQNSVLRGGNNTTITNNNQDDVDRAIFISPMLPTSAQVTANSNANNNSINFRHHPEPSASTIQQMLAMSKFNRSNRALKQETQVVHKEETIDINSKYEDVDSDDDDQDETQSSKPTSMKKRRLSGEVGVEQQKIERRERNREHAKKSRVRKKMMLETLSDQLNSLRYENNNLRRVVAERIPHLAPKILSECTTVESSLLATSWPSNKEICLGSDSTKNFTMNSGNRQYARILMEPDFRLIQALLHSQQNFVLSDPSLPDNPIVYASEGFCKLTGYKRQEVLGRNCRFLQGPGTDQSAVDMIRKGVTEGRDISVCLLNYKADGSPFWNQFFVAALRDADGGVVNFVGIQCEVNSIPISEIKDRVKKLPIPAGI